MNDSGAPLMMNVLETTDDLVLKILTWINCGICSLAIIANSVALHFLYRLSKHGDSFKATNYVFFCLTGFDLIRGCTGFEFYLLYFYHTDGATGLEELCPFFSFIESLSAITLSIALLLALTKAIILVATFMVKRYVNNRNILIALFFIIVSKVLYTGLRVLKCGVMLNHFSVECMIRDHYMPYQIYISFFLNYEMILILLILATLLIVVSVWRTQRSSATSGSHMPHRSDQDDMLTCALSIMLTSIFCYSIYIGFRFVNIRNITVSRFVFFNYRYFKCFAEQILLNLNSAINPFLYILYNRSIKKKLQMSKLSKAKHPGTASVAVIDP